MKPMIKARNLPRGTPREEHKKMQKCPTCNGKRKIKDYHVNNHFKQSLKMVWHEIIDCPDCKWFERNKEHEHSRLHKTT